jgi:DNA-binding response OmpR family regulator
MNQATTILIVEDDPAIAHSLRDGLVRGGYRAVWQATGAAGIDYAVRQHPQLIILDVRLPDQSGFDVCRELRRQGLHQPIIMLTARQDEVDKVLGLEMGADDYVTKPYSLRELLSRVRAQLRRAYGEFSAADANLLYAGDLVLDLGRGQVKREETILNLTPTEFRLLALLARHPGQALSRAQILDAVWGYAVEVEDERLVNVHVRRLREKIEVDPSRPSLILTVPGIGYRLVG